MNIDKIFKILICPKCRSELSRSDSELTCRGCAQNYPVRQGIPYLTEEREQTFDDGSGNDALINKLKLFFKKYPVLFNVIYYFFGASFVGKSAEKAIENLGKDSVILSLGSGIKITRKDVINIDFYPFTNVAIVADIAKLPFKENSVDAIVNESVLEHVRNPQAILQEIKRVLKVGGLVYTTVPFIASFHSSPEDYYRWSKEGLRELMRDFKEKEIGVRHGPTSALFSVVNDWLAVMLSFGSIRLQQMLSVILTIITFPFKVFDYVIYKFKGSEKIAYGFYYIGTKE